MTATNLHSSSLITGIPPLGTPKPSKQKCRNLIAELVILLHVERRRDRKSAGYGEVTVKFMEFDCVKGKDAHGSPVSTNTLAVVGLANNAAGMTAVS